MLLSNLFCLVCGPDTDAGPHTQVCLVRLWIETGCRIAGSSSPWTADMEQLDWWNARTVAEVRADMQLYHQYAEDNYENYRDRCFGYGKRLAFS